MRIVTQKTWLAVFCWFLSFVRFLGSIGLTAVLTIGTLDDFDRHWRWLAVAVWIIGATVDVIIAAALTIDLANKRKDAILYAPYTDCC